MSRNYGGRSWRHALATLCMAPLLGSMLQGCAITERLLDGTQGSETAEARPGEFDAAMAKGKTLFTAGQFGLALAAFEVALQIQPDSPRALNAVAATYDQLRRFDMADKYYARALQLAPDSSDVLNNVGYSHILRGDPIGAQRYLVQALPADGKDQVVVANLALARARAEGANVAALPAAPIAQPGALPGGGSPMMLRPPTGEPIAQLPAPVAAPPSSATAASLPQLAPPPPPATAASPQPAAVQQLAAMPTTAGSPSPVAAMAVSLPVGAATALAVAAAPSIDAPAALPPAPAALPPATMPVALTAAVPSLPTAPPRGQAVTVDLAVLAQLPPPVETRAPGPSQPELLPTTPTAGPPVEVNLGLLEWLGLSRPTS